MRAATRSLVTEAEFLALPESMDKVELIDGEVILSPAPTFWHQEILRRLLFALEAWRRASGETVTIGQSPIDVRFGLSRILQPDAFLLLSKLDREHQGPIDRVPEICVEVLSTNRVYDRVTKRLLYGAAGVRELWLVEPTGLIERWGGPHLERSEEVREQLETPLLPGFALDIDDLFEDI